MHIEFLKRYLKKQEIFVFLLLLAIVSSTAIQLIGPMIISNFIDTTIYQNNNGELLHMAIIYLGLSLTNILIAVFITYIAQKIGWKATNLLREDLVNHCINLDMSFHKEKTQGELIEIIDEDVNNLFGFFSKMGVVITSNLLLVTGVIVMYYIKDYRMGIAQSIFAIIALVSLLKVRKKGVEIIKKDRAIETSLFGFAGEAMNNTEDIKGSGSSSYVFQRFYGILKAWFPIRVKASVIMWSSFIVMLILQAFSYGINFTLGTFLWKKDVITIGTIYLFYNYTKFILDPLNILQVQIQQLQRVGAGIARISDLMKKKSTIIDSSSNNKVTINDELIIEDMCFSYTEEREILSHISLRVKPGQTVGLLGRTGSGKTTLAALLVRFYDIKSGNIKIGNHDIKEIPIKELRKQVVYVTQEIQILNASIRDNIAFYDVNISDEDIGRAIHAMELEQWFQKFPEGLNTIMGVGGMGLSAGEAQLLAFIRAFLSKPHIVILDEVTSKLDIETERCIQTAIDQLLEGKIGIVIAHRLQTIQKVDEIIILEAGKIIENDKQDKLKRDIHSKFYQLLVSAEKEGVLYE